ncbi:MAG: hypothetical protein ACE5EN_05780, partial [Nitrospinota bacterium]
MLAQTQPAFHNETGHHEKNLPLFCSKGGNKGVVDINPSATSRHLPLKKGGKQNVSPSASFAASAVNFISMPAIAVTCGQVTGTKQCKLFAQVDM